MCVCFIGDIPLSRPKKKKPRTKNTLGKKLFFFCGVTSLSRTSGMTNITDEVETKPQQSQVTVLGTQHCVLKIESGSVESSGIPGGIEEQAMGSLKSV